MQKIDRLKSDPRIIFGKQTFINAQSGKVTDKYDVIKELGTGSYGKVYLVKNKATGEERACKQLIKSKIHDQEKFSTEISIMAKADHPNIIKLYEIFEDPRHVYLIMEQCKGGELFDRIIARVESGQMYTEKQAANIFKQIMYAISYCHDQKICHRDMKAENVLFLGKEDDSPIKVIDFGLSKIFKEGDKIKKMTTRVGTAYYVSPEVLKGNYDERCDIWSCGVLLYILLSGNPPFNGATDMDIYKAVARKKYSFPDPEWTYISREAKDLISKMICDPDKRLTAQQVLQHPWIAQLAPNAGGNLTQINVASMKKYAKIGKLRKAVITFIANRVKDEEVGKLKSLFETLDVNKDGTLTVDEIEKGIKLLNSELDVSALFASIDTDKSGKIDYTEFLACCLDQKVYLREERLSEAFKMLDLDGSGKISKDEIKKALKLDKIDDLSLDKYIQECDINGDGEIDYNEFLNLMTGVNI